MRILTLGAGFIASHLPYEMIKDRLDPNHISIGGIINKYKPDILINCIGWGGNTNIDDCEKNKSRTFTTNTLIPIILGEECQARNIKLIHIGSGCIFQGQSPHLKADWSYPIVRKINGEIESEQEFQLFNVDQGWQETDPATPPSTYSRSKYATDLILETLSCATVLRIRMPLSFMPHPRNLLTKLIKYNRVVEEENSITCLKDLSRSVEFVIEKGLSGVFHCVNSQPVKHSRILEEYRKYVPNHNYEKISAFELNKITIAKRSNCILNNDKLTSLGFEFQPTEEAIIEYIKEYVKAK